MSIKLLCTTLSLVLATSFTAHGAVTVRIIERTAQENIRLDLPKFMGILEDLNEPARAESYACKQYLALLDQHGFKANGQAHIHAACNADPQCSAISVDQGESCYE